MNLFIHNLHRNLRCADYHSNLNLSTSSRARYYNHQNCCRCNKSGSSTIATWSQLNFTSRGAKDNLCSLKINGTYQTRQITLNASSAQSLPVKNTGWDIPFIHQSVGGSRRLTQVGGLPHSTLHMSIFSQNVVFDMLSVEASVTKFSSTSFDQTCLNRLFLSRARDSVRLGSELGSVGLGMVVRLDSGLVSFLSSGQENYN